MEENKTREIKAMSKPVNDNIAIIVFKALADESRLKIISILLQRNIEEELIKYALDFDIKKCRFVSTGKNEGLLDELLGELLIYG